MNAKKNYSERLKDFKTKQYVLPFLSDYVDREFIFNVRKVCTGSNCIQTTPQVVNSVDLVSKRVKYVPSNKLGTIEYIGNSFFIVWDDNKPDSQIDTEYGTELIKQCEILDDNCIDQKFNCYNEGDNIIVEVGCKTIQLSTNEAADLYNILKIYFERETEKIW